MLLIVTMVLFLMSMPAHEASRFFHGEVQNMSNEKHLLESLQGQVPPSPISQKAYAGHNISPLPHQLRTVHVPPSAPNPHTNSPAPRISQRTFISPNTAPLLDSQQKSPLPSPVPNGGT
uniref:Uncharacterized protein n=1 Tax=Fagus sylvatica TaxID=28930 RepID=A0A2N9F6K3_FAGSY